MTDDLVKRLRDFDYGADIYMVWSEDPDCVSEAADRIEAQAAEIERLKRQIQAKEDGLNVRDRRIEAQAAEIERLGAVVDALLQHEASSFWGTDGEKNRRASYRGVIRKAKKARTALGDTQ